MTKLPILLLFVLSMSIYGREFHEEYQKIQIMIDKGRLKSALSKAQSLANSNNYDVDEHGMAVTLYADLLRKTNSNKKALYVLKKLEMGRSNKYYLVLAECYLDEKDYANAYKTTQFGVYEQKGVAIYQNYFNRARACFGLKKYWECMEDCIRIKNAPIPGQLPVVKVSEEEMKKILENEEKTSKAEDEEDIKLQKKIIMELKKQAAILYAKARILYETERYGEDYSWYRQGREAEFAGEYKDAIECYNKVKSGTLKKAATCYIGHCLVELGKNKEAMKYYEKLYKNQFAELYQGEALYHAAVQTYLKDNKLSSTKEALALCEKMLSWIDGVKLSGKDVVLEGINDALKEDVIKKIERQLFRKDDCGNLIRTMQFPGSIINRLTTPWYFPYYELKGKLLYGFLKGELKRDKEAARAFTSAQKSCRDLIKNLDTIPALKASLINNSWLYPEKSTKSLSSKHKKVIKYATFLYLTEEANLAIGIFDMILSKQKHLRHTDIGCAKLGKAYCLLAQKKKAEALKILKRLHKNSRYQRLPVGIQASYLYGCQLVSDKKTKSKAYRILDEIGRNKHGELSPMALLALATAAVNHKDRTQAEKAADTLRKKYGKSVYAEAARTILAALKQTKSSKRVLEIIETENGNIKLHKRTVILPGTSKWESSINDLKPGDLYVYKLKFVSRDECKMIRSVQIGLEKDEPQIGASRGNNLEFLRTPLLYVSSLRYDNFKELEDPLTANTEEN